MIYDLINRAELPTIRIEIPKRLDDETCRIISEIVESILTTIKSAPTIDAEPVRHGAWTPKEVGAITTEFECSECGRTVTLTNDYFGKATNYASSSYPYCHCGAKMESEGWR